MVFVLTSTLYGCIGTKYLKENEKLLYRQSIDAPKYVNEEELRNLYAQRPNRKLLNLPISPLVSIYY
jgi:outer membrane protein insertion porin family